MEFTTYLGQTFGPWAAAAGILALALWTVYIKVVVPAQEKSREREDKRRQAEHDDRVRLLQVVAQNTTVMVKVTQSQSELTGAIRELSTDIRENRSETERISRDVDSIRDAVNELRGRLGQTGLSIYDGHEGRRHSY
jgi:chromosome segregation ATPase